MIAFLILICIMAFYRVTIWLESGEVYQGVMEHERYNVDIATTTFWQKAKQTYKNVVDVEAALLSSYSTAAKVLTAEEGSNKERKLRLIA
jgi:hypothetical protein